jgi:putative ABC transport system permease protein
MRLYDLLLRLYPASFRAEYGREMRAIFLSRWHHGRGVGSRLLLLLEACGDVLRNAPLLHWDILRQDVSIAWRTIRRAPSFSVTVILVAALGIAATTSVFSIADHVLIRPLPFRDAERLVKIWQLAAGGGTLEASPGHVRDWQAQASSFESVAAFSMLSANLVGAGEPLRLDGSRASGNLFDVLGVPTLLGRTLTPEDDREASTPTAVISERLWRARFGADPRAVGTAIILNDRARVIVGVMPRTFEFPTRAVDFWIPFQFAPSEYVYGNPFLQSIARLKTGVSRAQAHADVQQISLEISRRVNPGATRRVSARVIALRDEISPQSRLLLWCLLAAASGLLLIACTNLANLLLTRGLARRKELAVRAALGAGRHRLLRQMITEGALLAGAGGVIGVIVAAAGVPALARLVPSGLPIAAAPALDGRLLVSATIATLISAIGVGLMPALRMTRYADAGALREGARAGMTRHTERLRSWLVVAQVGASVVLLVTSGLLVRAVLQVQAIDPGFSANGVLTLRTALPLPKYERVHERHQFFDRVLGDVRALPGVTSAAYITGLPLAMRGMVWSVSIPGRPQQLPGEQRTVSLRFVTPQFFSTMGIPIRMGRDIADSDSQTASFVAVVSESFANRYWPGENPIGRRFTGSGPVGDRTIVGVVGDVRWRGLEPASEPQIYLSSRQVKDGQLPGHVPKELVVKSSIAASALVPSIRAIVGRADPQQPVSDIQWVADIVNAETAPRAVQVRVLGAFAGVAFLLAGIGLHGLLAYGVSQRAREIGVRVALGAERRSILAMVLRRGLHLALLGIGIGAALSLAAGRALQALLAGVSPTDAVTFGGAVALAIVMTLLGSLLPALQATRVDPLQVIRTE